tara:strand:+ start:558 stop:728 length:171 start_codon:yes stop_codon:yes gene_type:complete
MCIICVEITKGKLRWQEAARNLAEIYLEIDPDHRDDVTKEVIELMTREQKEDENNS